MYAIRSYYERARGDRRHSTAEDTRAGAADAAGGQWEDSGSDEGLDGIHAASVPAGDR